jgi:hypothetical protein
MRHRKSQYNLAKSPKASATFPQATVHSYLHPSREFSSDSEVYFMQIIHKKADTPTDQIGNGVSAFF